MLGRGGLQRSCVAAVGLCSAILGFYFVLAIQPAVVVAPFPIQHQASESTWASRPTLMDVYISAALPIGQPYSRSRASLYAPTRAERLRCDDQVVASVIQHPRENTLPFAAPIGLQLA